MATTSTEIRLAAEADAAALLAVYAPYVRETPISFEVEPPSEDEFRRRIRTTLEWAPWLVCAAGRDVLGYAYAGRFHARAAYQWTVEVTVYVRRDRHGQGIGRGLYTALLGCLCLQGFRTAVGIITIPNPASIGLHEQMGFRPAGVLRGAGWKHGRWHDIGWWQAELGTRDVEPVPPRPLAAVAGTPEWGAALAAGGALVRA